MRRGHSRPAEEARVSIVTGGSSRTGRDVALGLAAWSWAVVVVHLHEQRRAEATIAAILAVDGRTVGVRADLEDDLDVDRLFAESIAAFGRVDVIVHTTTDSASILYRHAARQVREGGAIVSVSDAEPIAPGVARLLRERGITVRTAPPGAVLACLDTWRRRQIG